MTEFAAAPPPLLTMHGIHKFFPGVHALKGVDFEVRVGEVHALVGENGAGKSTLMHILAGVYPQDKGEISFNSLSQVRFNNEQQAQDAGIGIVYQERSLVPTLTVAENIFAGRQPVNRLGLLAHGRMHRETRAILSRLAMNIAPSALVEDLSPAEQQMVEIAKAISRDARLLIFDEPTAALTEHEEKALFTIIQALRSQVGIIYISHRLEEIFKICDRVTVLKDGEQKGTFPIAQVTRSDLIALMVGRAGLKSLKQDRRRFNPEAAPVLEVKDLSDGARVKSVSFAIRPGEIVALAGLAGAGRTETALALFGDSAQKRGRVLFNGKPLAIRSPQDAIRAGIGYLPEDRRSAGLFLEMAITNNIASANLGHFGRIFLNNRLLFEVANDFRRKLGIATPDVFRPVQNLSGGNQQKVVISRWLLVNPKVLIVDEPTRGVDVGAKAEVHALLQDLAMQGTAIIIISSELPEVLAVADRIIVLCDGRVAGELSGENATEPDILHLASAFEQVKQIGSGSGKPL